jgi:TfoX/Sxy family transcriptional regulator of competence genes
MAYDEMLEARIRDMLGPRADLESKKMFGGLCFLINGNMACGVLNNDFIAKVDPESHDSLLKKPAARPFDFSGRPMKGILYVGPQGVKAPKDLRFWVNTSLAHALSKPPKAARKKSGSKQAAGKVPSRVKTKPRKA